MWWTGAEGLEDRDTVGAIALIDSFDRWLSARLAEAYLAGKDLAFFDTAIHQDEEGRPVGWAHLLLEPGSQPPLGESWTIYRLQD